MSGSLRSVSVEGLISRIHDEYVITTDSGIQYRLSAIMPYEAVSPDFDSGRFALALGKKVTVAGVTDGDTIWGARIMDENLS